MNNLEAERLREAWLAMLAELAPNFMITFSFGYEIKPENASKSMRTFFNAIQRIAYGRDWADQLNRAWPVAYGFFEHPDTNPHYHVATHFDASLADALKEHGIQRWKKYSSRGQLHITEVRTPKQAWSYITKRVATRRRFDEIFVYSDTRDYDPLYKKFATLLAKFARS